MTFHFPFRRCAVTRLVLTACVLGLVLQPAAASSVKLPYTEIHEMKLDNGLRALIVETHDAPVIDVQVWYHVGSKNEVPGRTGFAHFFEHLMFDGTKNLGSNEFSDYIIRSGGTDNAYTTEDTTVFWETVPSNMLPVVLWLEADRMRNLEINEKVFDNERQVVEEERRLRFDNPPYGTVVETLYDHAYTVHPYRHMTIGSMEDLNHASIQDIQDFYDTYYVPNNATLVIVGDVDWRQAAVDVQKYFGPVKAGNAPEPERDSPGACAKGGARGEDELGRGPAGICGRLITCPPTARRTPTHCAWLLRSCRTARARRIYTRLIYDKQIAVQAESSGNFTEDPNLFFVFAVMNGGHSPAEGQTQVEAELTGLKTNWFLPPIWKRPRTRFCAISSSAGKPPNPGGGVGICGRGSERPGDADCFKHPVPDHGLAAELARHTAVVLVPVQNSLEGFHVRTLDAVGVVYVQQLFSALSHLVMELSNLLVSRVCREHGPGHQLGI